MRDHDRDGKTLLAASPGEGLPMVASRRRDDPTHIRPLTAQPLGIDETTAHFEGAGGRVVFVLDPHFGAGALGQQRPGVLWRPGEARVDQAVRFLEV